MKFCMRSILFWTRTRRLTTTIGVYSRANVDLFSRIKHALQRKCLAKPAGWVLGLIASTNTRWSPTKRSNETIIGLRDFAASGRVFSFDCTILMSLIKLWGKNTVILPIHMRTKMFAHLCPMIDGGNRPRAQRAGCDWSTNQTKVPVLVWLKKSTNQIKVPVLIWWKKMKIELWWSKN